MANLKTRYMGLELKNPIIVGASNLVTNIDNLKKMEEKGAAAIVYKTLFEEQINLENLEMYELRTEYEERNAEMITLFPNSKTVSQDPHGTSDEFKEGQGSGFNSGSGQPECRTMTRPGLNMLK